MDIRDILKPNPEKAANLIEGAQEIRNLYDSYRQVGFNDKQAMSIVNTIIQATIEAKESNESMTNFMERQARGEFDG